MKLETLLAKDYILAIDALGRGARLTAEDIVRGYERDVAEWVARGLGRIALNTKDKDAVIESARTIGRYEGWTAGSVAEGLAWVAMGTKDKETVMESARVIGRYEGWASRGVACELKEIAIDTKDKEAVIKVAKIMSLDEVVRTVGRYEGWDANGVAGELTWVARSTEDKETVMESARVIGRYEGRAASNVTKGLAWVARGTKDKETVMESARVIGRYEGEAGIDVAQWLGEIARNTQDKETVMESARVIGRYEGRAASNVAWGLGKIARDTKDKETVIKVAKIMSLDEVVRTVGRYEGWAAHGVAWGLGEIAGYTKDEETVMTACRLVNTAGSGVFDLLDAKDVVSIRESGLDKLIDGKSSFDAVVAYVKSGKELPLPTSENIADYGKLVKDHLASAYGMDKELDNGRLLMLFSVDRSERKALAELVNRSSERDRRAYSIMVNEGSEHPLDIDRSRLPYLSVVAIAGSKDPARYREAFDVVSRIVGKKTVGFARDSFNSSYKPKLEEIVGLMKEGKVEDAVKVLRETKDESINDVLACMDYRDAGFSVGNAMLSAVESNDPLDYDSRVQIACVYLPRSYNEGIYEYCKDDRFTLVRYDIGGKTLGSAICYMEDGTFLVDSVEGHRTFRKPKIFDAVRRDLVERAKEKGAKRILFSKGGTNETPKKFMDYLGKLGLKKGKIKMKLDTKGYLEADKNGASGYVSEI